MIDYISMLDFCQLLNGFKHEFSEGVTGNLIYCSFVSGAKLNVYQDGFRLTTKDNVAREFEYSERLCVALEVQCENVFITIYNCIDDNIYENVFNCMIFERHP